MTLLRFCYTVLCAFTALFVCSCETTSSVGHAGTTTLEDRQIIDMINKRVPTGFCMSQSGMDTVYYNINAEKAAELVTIARKAIEDIYLHLGLKFNYSIRFFITDGVDDEEMYDLKEAIFSQRWDSIIMPIFVDDPESTALEILGCRVNGEAGNLCVRYSIMYHFLDSRYRPNFKLTYDSYENIFFSSGMMLVGGHGYHRLIRHMLDGNLKYINEDLIIRDGIGALSFNGNRLLSMRNLYDVSEDQFNACYLFWSSAYDTYGSCLFQDIMTELKRKNRVRLYDVKQAYLRVTGRELKDDLRLLIQKKNVSCNFPL